MYLGISVKSKAETKLIHIMVATTILRNFKMFKVSMFCGYSCLPDLQGSSHRISGGRVTTACRRTQQLWRVAADREARGIAERRIRGEEMLPTQAISQRASAVWGEEEGASAR